MTRIGYKDAHGEDLYVEKLKYPDPVLNRVSSITHKWGGNFVSQDSVIENFVYDGCGSLSIFETDMVGRMNNGTYEYDVLGRLTHKTEAGSEVIFDYVDGSYQPVSVSVNGNESALAFDPTGMWAIGVGPIDETNKGIQKKMKEVLFELAAKNPKLLKKLIDDYKTTAKSGNRISGEMLKLLERELFEPNKLIKVTRGDENKITYSKSLYQWGNIEFKTDDGGKTYFSSYNYASDPIGHFWLDVVGYWMSN